MKTKNKIFFIMSTDDYSGAEAVNFEIIRRLKNDYDFFWVSRKGKINRFLDEANIKWIKIDSLSKKEVKRIIKTYHPDILHATDYRASVICALSNGRTPYISHIHNNSPWIKKLNINSLAYLYSSIKAQAILTVSDSIKNEYIFSGLIKNKIYKIGNPVSRKNILERSRTNNKIKRYDICCVARVSEPKDPQRFIKIINEIKKYKNDIKCVWVGDGELYDMAQKMTKDLNLSNNIIFKGFSKNPYKYMAESKVFLMTSSWEGYGLAAFEALTIGLPCVVTNVGGLKEIVTDKCGLLCNDDQEILNEILKLLSNKKYYNDKSKNAISRSIELSHRNTTINNLKSIYSSILAKGSR